MPVDDHGRDVLTRIGSVSVPNYSPEHGWGFIMLQPPTRRDLGRWLYGIAASFASYDDRHPTRARKIARVHDAFVQIDAARRAWHRTAHTSSQIGGGELVGARRRRRAASRRLARARRTLDAFMRYGLDARLGQRLVHDDRTWVHLAVRGIKHPELRVCEQCARVFRSRRARRCPDCQKRPVRIRLVPIERGGWHQSYRVGKRFAGVEFDRTVHYTTECRECKVLFVTTRPNRRLCRNCGGHSGRVRRHRRSESRTGRQSFRFVHADGAAAFSVSCADLRGETIRLESIDGVIETPDAEVAWQLRLMPTLAEETDPAGARASRG